MRAHEGGKYYVFMVVDAIGGVSSMFLGLVYMKQRMRVK